jgi:hypothetical protein
MEMLAFTSLLEKMFALVFLYYLRNIETNIKLLCTLAFIAASIVGSPSGLKTGVEPHALDATVAFGPQHSLLIVPMQINIQSPSHKMTALLSNPYQRKYFLCWPPRDVRICRPD